MILEKSKDAESNKSQFLRCVELDRNCFLSGPATYFSSALFPFVQCQNDNKNAGPRQIYSFFSDIFDREPNLVIAVLFDPVRKSTER